MIRKWLAKVLRIAEGPQGPRGYPGPQGISGIAHVVLVDADGARLMTRDEFRSAFGDLPKTESIASG